ncbi:MAG: 50S ribosomal protein L32 [Candidatus Omnitrophota bacterium]|nr:50S ribosomal protein L32 [Candidatus Omnitrophota bacterium]
MPKVKHRHSKARGRKRRTHDKIEAPSSVKCVQCGKEKKPHCVCSHCGYYGKVKVKHIETAEERKARKDAKKKKA